MKYFLLALSDMHFVADASKNHYQEYLKPLCDALTQFPLDETNKLTILVCGDCAYSGKRIEYDNARLFFSDLETNIKQKYTSLDISYVLCPGNHDCDFEKYSSPDDSKREQIFNSKNKTSTLYENLDFVNKKLEDYFLFRNGLVSKSLLFSHFYFDRYEYNLGGHRVKIISYNSSVSWDKDFGSDKVYVDSKMISDNLGTFPNDINVSISHYPLEWYNRDNTDYYLQVKKQPILL